MSKTFRVEAWSHAVEEMKPLFPDHWEDVAVNKDKIKLAMDYDRYDQLEKAAVLHLVVARDDGKVFGYFCLIISKHLHYRDTLMAASDFYYIKPEYRNPSNAALLFEAAERTLKERGVVYVAATTKVHKDKGKFLEYMGWKNTERQYTKYLGE